MSVARDVRGNMAARAYLPDRRPCLTEPIEAGGVAAYATIGFDPETGAAREIFLRPRAGARVGSATDHLADDVAVVISVALQHGVPAAALARSLGHLPDGTPASIVGATMQLLVREAIEA